MMATVPRVGFRSPSLTAAIPFFERESRARSTTETGDNERRASLGEKSKVVGVVAANRRSAGQDYAGRVGTVFGAGGCSTASSSGNFSPCTAIGVPIQSGFAR
jgi:hypothetical protein